MLHEFVTTNREELIANCRSKVKIRNSPPVGETEIELGVPLVLEQLVGALRAEEENPGAERDRLFGPVGKTPAARASSRAARLHGKDLLEQGYSVEQVVHDYGDICQSITELAAKKDAPVTIDEFHTLNRLLDNAIADALSSYGHHHDAAMATQGELEFAQRMGTLASQQRRLVDTVLATLDAIKIGNIGLMGATGSLLEDSLVQLRGLIDSSSPESLSETKKS